VLQCVAVCCRAYYSLNGQHTFLLQCDRVLHRNVVCVAVFCSALQCVAVCGGVLQCTLHDLRTSASAVYMLNNIGGPVCMCV